MHGSTADARETREAREILEIQAGGRRWRLARLGDLESLWNQLAESAPSPGASLGASPGADPATLRRRRQFLEDERLPYWTEIWPSSYLLADWIAWRADLVRGRRCLDVGCGLGLTALTGAAAGGLVTGLDYEWDALRFARENVRLNRAHLARESCRPPDWLHMDWRHPAVRREGFDLLWAGDVVYEARFIEPVAAFFEHAVRPGGRIWLGEPQRDVYAPFVERMRALGFTASVAHQASVRARNWPTTGVPVSIWEFVKPAPPPA